MIFKCYSALTKRRGAAPREWIYLAHGEGNIVFVVSFVVIMLFELNFYQLRKHRENYVPSSRIFIPESGSIPVFRLYKTARPKILKQHFLDT